MSTLAPKSTVTEDDIHRLVHRFYNMIRDDAELGPIFNTKITNWEPHLAQMCDFWSSVMLKTGKFQGRPMPKHIALTDMVGPEHFKIWLSLFERAALDVCTDDVAAAFLDRAERIAESLKYGMFGADGSRVCPAA